MPEVLCATLRRSYQMLPSGKMRWRCSEGQQFLHLLADAADAYGVTRCAAAIGRTTSGTHYMLGQRFEGHDWDVELPSARELRPLVAAYDAVRARRAEGRQVRRSTREYRDLHVVLTTLIEQQWRVEVIAATAKVPARELRRFLPAPSAPMLAAMALEDLADAWGALKAARGPSAIRNRNDRFLKLLHTCADLGNSRAKMAHAVGLEPERITTLMTHGRADLRRKPRG